MTVEHLLIVEELADEEACLQQLNPRHVQCLKARLMITQQRAEEAAGAHAAARPCGPGPGGERLAQSTPVPVVVRVRRTPQCPPLRYTSAAILPNCPGSTSPVVITDDDWEPTSPTGTSPVGTAGGWGGLALQPSLPLMGAVGGSSGVVRARVAALEAGAGAVVNRTLPLFVRTRVVDAETQTDNMVLHGVAIRAPSRTTSQ